MSGNAGERTAKPICPALGNFSELHVKPHTSEAKRGFPSAFKLPRQTRHVFLPRHPLSFGARFEAKALCPLNTCSVTELHIKHQSPVTTLFSVLKSFLLAVPPPFVLAKCQGRPFYSTSIIQSLSSLLLQTFPQAVLKLLNPVLRYSQQNPTFSFLPYLFIYLNSKSHCIAPTGLELLCKPDWSQIHRNLPAFDFPVLRLKTRATTPSHDLSSWCQFSV